MPFYFKMSNKFKLNKDTYKILLYFNFLQIFYGLTMKPKVYKVYKA